MLSLGCPREGALRGGMERDARGYVTVAAGSRDYRYISCSEGCATLHPFNSPQSWPAEQRPGQVGRRSDPQMSAGAGLDAPPVDTCDGEPMLAGEARAIARKYYIAGFFALPWLWATSVWLFFPHLKGGDPVVKYCEALSQLSAPAICSGLLWPRLTPRRAPARWRRRPPLRSLVCGLHAAAAPLDAHLLDRGPAAAGPDHVRQNGRHQARPGGRRVWRMSAATARSCA